MRVKKIIDYLIVETNDTEELRRLVNENITDWKWQPFGEPFVHQIGREVFKVCQTMVKYVVSDD